MFLTRALGVQHARRVAEFLEEGFCYETPYPVTGF